jgi:hypothetical protein
MGAHALLSPSSSKRWFECTPSAKLELGFPDTSSTAAEEGTLAHEIGEAFLNQHNHPVPAKIFKLKLDEFKKHTLYEDVMLEHAENYAGFVLSKMRRNSYLFVETRLDLTKYVPEAFGTTDAIVIDDKILDLSDLKYGKGVKVFAEDNMQLKLYALGTLEEYRMEFDIEIVRMNIYQPRMNNIDTWEIGASELLEWGENILKPRAEMAFKGEGETIPGDHCRFCRAKSRCKALATYGLELAKKDFVQPHLLSDAELMEVYGKQEVISIWVKAVSDYIFAQAVAGKEWKGFKLVEGKSNRVFKDAAETEKLLLKNGFKDIYTPKQLLGIGALEKAIGKKPFQEHVILIKPKGAPALVPDTDSRAKYEFKKTAAEDFGPVEEDELLN